MVGVAAVCTVGAIRFFKRREGMKGSGPAEAQAPAPAPEPEKDAEPEKEKDEESEPESEPEAESESESEPESDAAQAREDLMGAWWEKLEAELEASSARWEAELERHEAELEAEEEPIAGHVNAPLDSARRAFAQGVGVEAEAVTSLVEAKRLWREYALLRHPDKLSPNATAEERARAGDEFGAVKATFDQLRELWAP